MQNELLVSDLLSPSEREEYTSLMIIVDRAAQSFVDAGKALAIIRDKRLYRERYDTFERFCREEFKMGRAYATRLINGFSTVKSLASSDGLLPANERVVRELNKAPSHVRQSAWDSAKKISGNGKPTSATVKRAVLEFIPNGQQQRLDREIIERLQQVNRLLNVDTDLAGVIPDVLNDILQQVAKASTRLRNIKLACLHAHVNSRIDAH